MCVHFRSSYGADLPYVGIECSGLLRTCSNGCLRFRIGAARDSSSERRSWSPRRAGVARAVDPLGTVVQPPPASPPAAWPEPYAASNCDEATFRPVLRAPAPPEARPEDAARPLPHTTTIPVQSLREPGDLAPAPRLHALSTAVVIPAALSRDPGPAPSFNLDKYSVEEATRETTDARPNARSSATERACEAPPDSLPKGRQSGDIQPAARHRVRRSPTPKSDSERFASDDSSRDKKSSRIRESPQRRNEDARAPKSNEVRERRESTPKVERAIKIEPVQRESVPKEHIPKEPVSKVTGSKESTPKESVLKEPVPKKTISKESVFKDITKKESFPKDVTKKESVSKDVTKKEPVSKKSSRESVPKEPVVQEPVIKEPIVIERAPKDPILREPIATMDAQEEVPSVAVTLKLSSKKKSESLKKNLSRKSALIYPQPFGIERDTR